MSSTRKRSQVCPDEGKGSQQQDNTKAMNLGHYFEDNLGAFILYKLFEKKDVYDWKFGMEKNEFPKFEDIVVGIRPKKTDEMAYYAFQLKGYDNQDGKVTKSIKMKTLLHELTEGSKEMGTLYTDYFLKGLKKMEPQVKEQVKKIILFLQFELKWDSKAHSKYFTSLKKDDLGVLRNIIPINQNGQFMALSELAKIELRSAWKGEEQDEVNNFLENILIFSKQPSPHVIKDIGSKFDYWDLLRIKTQDLKFDRLCQWVSKRELMDKKVTFQGKEDALIVRELIDEPDVELLIKLFVDEEISIGKEVKGLGEHERYYIERTFTKVERGKYFAKKTERELLCKKVVLIEGEPGLGKTIALKHAASVFKNHEGSNVWVMEVNVASMAQVFQDIPHEKNAFKVLHKAVTYNDKYGGMCFEKLERNTELKIALFLDAFDEIASNFKDTALKWIKNICKCPRIRTIWISTRHYDSGALMRVCGVYPYHIDKFVRSDQIVFLRKFWEVQENNSRSNEKFEVLASSILNYSEVHESVEEIIGLPLYTMMLAEIYEKECKKIIMDDNIEVKCASTELNLVKFTILSIFEEFIDRKFRREHEKYATIISNTRPQFKDIILSREKRKFLKKHGLISMHHLFKQFIEFESIFSKSHHQLDTFLKDLQTGNEISGFIADFQEGEKLSFLHLLFAEYFAAHWLFETLRWLQGEEEYYGERPLQLKRLLKFLQIYYTKPENSKVRLFLSLLAAKGDGELSEFIRSIHSGLRNRSARCIDAQQLSRPIKDRLGRLPIHVLLENNALEYMDALKGIPMTSPTQTVWEVILCNEALLFASCVGDVERVKHALSCGADINHKGQRISIRYTALHYACLEKQVEIVKLLLENEGVHINAVTDNNSTPLHIACENGSAGIAQTLIKAGATIDSRDCQGRTPLHVAQGRAICNMLLDKGAELHALDLEHKTPLHYACENLCMDTVKVLVEKGAHINAHDQHYITPLHVACEMLCMDTVKILVERGANIKAIDSDGNTPLNIAYEECRRKDLDKYRDEWVPYFIKCGADVATIKM